MKRNKKLIRQQLEITLQKFRPLLSIPMPPRGWIRAVRDALGMNGRQLADRLNVTRQRAALIEKDELGSSATLKTMRRVAESLDCVFVYALVVITIPGFVRELRVKQSMYSNNLPIFSEYFPVKPDFL
jgi:predicted DNA-binding mobile mystery protein A